jgi:hypothetical protein
MINLTGWEGVEKQAKIDDHGIEVAEGSGGGWLVSSRMIPVTYLSTKDRSFVNQGTTVITAVVPLVDKDRSFVDQDLPFADRDRSFVNQGTTAITAVVPLVDKDRSAMIPDRSWVTSELSLTDKALNDYQVSSAHSRKGLKDKSWTSMVLTLGPNRAGKPSGSGAQRPLGCGEWCYSPRFAVKSRRSRTAFKKA